MKFSIVEQFDGFSRRLLMLLLILLVGPLAFAKDLLPTLTQESFGSYGTYIQPNEDRFDLFSQANRDLTGAFIGVGTFRVLAAASQGHFSHVFFMDVDQAVVDFNQRQIEALKHSSSAAEFLARLLELPQAQPLIENILRDKTADQLSLYSIAAEKMSELAISHSPSQQREFADRFAYVDKILNLLAKHPESTFLTDTQAFAKLKTLATSGRMYSIAGNLAGKKTINELSNWLRNQHIEVGVLDVSNAPDYIIRGEKNGMADYYRNLLALPFAKQARVNFTAEYGPSRAGGWWSYFSVNAQDYIKEAPNFTKATSPYGEDSPYGQYILHISNTPADLVAQSRKACSLIFSE